MPAIRQAKAAARPFMAHHPVPNYITFGGEEGKGRRFCALGPEKNNDAC